MRHLLYILGIIVILVSCTSTSQKGKELPVARVYNKYLYQSELKDAIPANINGVDSLQFVKDYIDRWVQKELTLYNAELNLNEQEKDVEDQINEYRTSLLIFKYKQQLLRQKLDTVVSDEEIQKYYEENGSNFILNNDLVKALYIKIPRTAPDIWRVRGWYRSQDEEKLQKLDAYCYEHAKAYDYFDEQWILYSELEKQLPPLRTTPERILRYPTLERRDSLYYYFVRFDEFKLESSVAPLEYVHDNIRNIIINKRKIEFINRLESDIYNDAINRGNFSIY